MLTAYDHFAYPGRSYLQTSPNQLAAMAILHGLSPGPPSRCSLLELGCGDGTNLLAMAEAFPQSRFTGWDLAPSAIACARSTATQLGLLNVQFDCRDVAIRCEAGPFDYVVAHGLFSWVPASARNGILELCARSLNEQGVAYISYNAFPGCHLREMSRRMMRYHVRQLEAPRDRVAQARSLLHLLVNARTDKTDAYHQILQDQYQHALDYNEAAFFHDDLSDCNQPFYFHEFMELAEANGLQFLAESDLRSMEPGEACSAEARDLLQQMEAVDPLVKEQYLDFLTGRRFRQTLLCRKGIEIDRSQCARRLGKLRLCAQLEEINPSAESSDGEDCYKGPKGAGISAGHPVLKCALKELRNSWPQSVSFEELCAGVQQQDDRKLLENFCLKAVAAGAMELRAEPSPIARNPPDRPRAGLLARHQSHQSKTLTTLLHTRVRIPEPAVHLLLRLMDGTRTHAELTTDFSEALQATGTPAFGSELSGLSKTQIQELVSDNLESLLQELATLGLVAA